MNEICDMCDRPVLFRGDNGAFLLSGVTLCHRCALALCLRKARNQIAIFPKTKGVQRTQRIAAFEMMGIVVSEPGKGCLKLNLRKIAVTK